MSVNAMARSAPGTFALLFFVLAASVLAATKWAYATPPRTQQPQNINDHAGEFTGGYAPEGEAQFVKSSSGSPY